VSQRQHCVIIRSKCRIVLIRSSCDSNSVSFRRDSFRHRFEAGAGAIAKTEEQLPDFVQSEARLSCSLYDREPMEHSVVAAPLTTDPLSGKKHPNPFIYRKIKNPFPLTFWSIDLRGVGDLPCSVGWEAENRTLVEAQRSTVVHAGMACAAKRNQVPLRIVARLAPEFFVVHFKIGSGAARLTSRYSTWLRRCSYRSDPVADEAASVAQMSCRSLGYGVQEYSSFFAWKELGKT
jgi:hypothetical protein